MTSEVANEYGNRFLVELIQNGYDAQPREASRGSLFIVLDEEEGDHGVMYVGNTGRPFTGSNFYALSQIARSDKPPGEGIGNKGLGFRSVLQVCEWPEIYSAGDTTDPGFNGFCFGFARDEDLWTVIDSEDEFEIVRAEFDRRLLPFPLKASGPHLDDLRRLGAVTVVRLPLRDIAASEAAQTQLDGIVAGRAPVLLFLDRVETLTTERHRLNGETDRHTLTRSSRPIALPDADERVRCHEVMTDGRRYFVATYTVAETAVMTVIRHSIGVGQLSEWWNKWTGDAEVSVAIPLEASEDEEFHLFTFLPMATSSPLGGHLNAPFFTKLARVDLSEAVPLNSFFFDSAASVCAELVRTLTSNGSSIPDKRNLVIDCLTWDADHWSWMESAITAKGMNPKDSKIVPGLAGRRKIWIALNDAYLWDETGYECLTLARLSRLGYELVDTEIGSRRLGRLRALHETLMDCDMVPSTSTLAAWCEALAASLGSGNNNLAVWNRFYRDLAKHFIGRSGSSLTGRKILLDHDGRVRVAGPWEGTSRTRIATVFIPPGRSADAGIDEFEDVEDEEELRAPPKPLRRSITFLNEGIELRSRESRRLPVLELLEGQRLVERFDRRALLLHVRRLLTPRAGADVKRQALRWVFLQHRAARTGLKGLDELGLYVPTRGGWAPAREAYFSPGWPDSMGDALGSVVDGNLASAGQTLTMVANNFLLPPTDAPFNGRDLKAWKDFLLMLGVRDGLWPVGLRLDRLQLIGRDWSPEVAARRVGIHPDLAAAWSNHVAEEWDTWGNISHPYTSYRSQEHLWILPGQDAYDGWPARSRLVFAELLIATIASWPSALLEFSFQRHEAHHLSKPDRQSWPSLAGTFLDRTAWFPMTDPRERENVYFVPLAEGWQHSDDQGLAPTFIRLPPPKIRRLIQSSTAIQNVLGTHGLTTWNDPSSAAKRLAELPSLLSDGFVESADRSKFRKAYEGAWSDICSAGNADAESVADLPLVTEGSRNFGILTPSAGGSGPPRQLFVRNESSAFNRHVLETAQMGVLANNAKDGDQVSAMLSTRNDLDVRRLSEARVEVLADGEILEPGVLTGEPLLEVAGRWISDLVGLAIEFQANRFTVVTDRVLKESLSRLHRIRLRSADTLILRFDGQLISLPDYSSKAVPLEDELHPLIVVRSNSDFGWPLLQAIADSICLLVERPTASAELRAATLRLQAASDGEWRPPTIQELAEAFEEPEERIEEILLGLRGDAEVMLQDLLPVLVCLFGPSATTRFPEPGDRDSFLEALQEALSRDDSERLLSLGEQALSPDELRREMGIALVDFNRALVSLGRRPIRFERDHEAEFDRFLGQHRDAIRHRLREAFMAQFKAYGDLRRYAELRMLEGLGPNADWLDYAERPTPDQMTEQVEDWLRDNGIMPGVAASLPPLDDVVDANERFLDGALPTLRGLVAAWCRKEGLEVNEDWRDISGVRERLQDSGCLDFEPLNVDMLLRWVVRLGCWPARMPESSDPDYLGVHVEDLEQGDVAKTEERERRQKLRSTISLDGHEFYVDREDLRHLAEAARDSVTPDFLASARTVTRLLNLPDRGSSKRATGTAKPPKRQRRTSSMSDDQRNAIGLVGERLAYEWLRSRYPQCGTDIWVSENRAIGIGGEPGNDSLGYDFRVRLQRTTRLFEVKCTPGEEYEFDMGQTEVRAARAAPKGDYQIIFIARVLDSSQRKLLLLPNPLEAGVSSIFQQVNQGIRFEFRPR